MEEEGQTTQTETVPTADKWYTPLMRATPLSKYLALALFVILPFVGFWLGVGYETGREHPVVAQGDTPSVAGRGAYCEPNDGCCEASLSTVQKGNYVVVKNAIECPAGTQPNMLRCESSLVWCDPSTVTNLDNLEKSNVEYGNYTFEVTETGVQFHNGVTGEVVQTIFLKDIPIKNPKTYFIEVYGSESAMERQDDKSILTNLDVNFDGYNDLGILVDTGPVEPGYVFYLYNENTERFIIAMLEGEQTATFVVYAPAVNTAQKVLQGKFTVTNPRRIDYFEYMFDEARGVFIERIENM